MTNHIISYYCVFLCNIFVSYKLFSTLLQITAETAYDMMSPGPSVRRRPKTKGSKKRYAQPQDIREGMANAYMLVKEVIF